MTILLALDFETTGLSLTEDLPVQVSLVLREHTNGHYLDYPLVDQLCDPGKPIDPGATAVHGITDAMVAGMPSSWSVVEYAAQMAAYYAQGRESYLVGFNSNNFDVPMANNILQRQAFTLPHIDVLRFARFYFPEVRGLMGGKTLGELHQVFLNRTLEGAHGAQADVIGTLDLLRAMQVRAQVTLAQLASEQSIARAYPVLPLGKHIGKPISEVPYSWAKFLSAKTDLDPDLRATVDAIMNRPYRSSGLSA